jgi:hypothetical protein
VPVIYSPNLPKRPQVFYYDSLVHQQPKPGRSAHVTALPIDVPYEELYLAFQLSRRRLTASLRMHPRVLNSMRFYLVPCRNIPIAYRWCLNSQNEKRKDKEVTARIERILKIRDQAIKGVEMGARAISIYALCWR